MLKINNLSAKIDKKSILNGFSLEINPGEVHAIMGPTVQEKVLYLTYYLEKKVMTYQAKFYLKIKIYLNLKQKKGLTKVFF